MTSQAFLSGMAAFREGKPLDRGQAYDWRCGWRRAQFNAATPSPSPPQNSSRILQPKDAGVF